MNCDEMAGIDRQFANRNCYRLSRISWALPSSWNFLFKQ